MGQSGGEVRLFGCLPEAYASKRWMITTMVTTHSKSPHNLKAHIHGNTRDTTKITQNILGGKKLQPKKYTKSRYRPITPALPPPSKDEPLNLEKTSQYTPKYW